MPKFLDIFYKSKRISKPKEPIKITADYREKNSLVPSELISLGLEVEFRELKVADYIVKDVAIERKTVPDFISSMISHRLIRQIESLQQYPNKLLIIEGIEEEELYADKNNGVNANAIRGFLLSILLKYNIPVIYTKNYEDTAKFLWILSRKKEKELPLKAKRKSLNKKEQMQFLLEGFPGIGPKTAKRLLNEFKSLKEIFNASLENIKKIIGKKAEIFKILDENY